MYYIRVAGKVYGPYPLQQLQDFVSQGRITPQSEVSNDGQTWFAGNAIPGLFQAQPGAPISPELSQQAATANPYATPQSYDQHMTADPSIDPNRSFFGCYKDVWHKSNIGSGRSRRKEYWAWSVFNSLFLIGIGLLGGLVGAFLDATGGSPEIAVCIFGLLAIGFLIAAIVPGITLMIRRLHDINTSGWLCLLAFVPYVNSLFTIIIGCIGGTAGPNKYGPDPKGRG